MAKIHIVTDSTADLTSEQIAQYSIHLVPLTIQIDGKTYIDGVDIEAKSFLEIMASSKELPKSSFEDAIISKKDFASISTPSIYVFPSI